MLISLATFTVYNFLAYLQNIALIEIFKGETKIKRQYLWGTTSLNVLLLSFIVNFIFQTCLKWRKGKTHNPTCSNWVIKGGD